MIPAATILMHSHLASDLVIILLFVVAVWNGGNFYVEVFGRKFEKELDQLKKEMDVLTQGMGMASTPSTPRTDMTADSGIGDVRATASGASTPGLTDDGARPRSATKQRKSTGLDNSPLVLPQAETSVPPEIQLDGKKDV